MTTSSDPGLVDSPGRKIGHAEGLETHGEDLLREMVAVFCQALMHADAEVPCGASLRRSLTRAGDAARRPQSCFPEFPDLLA